MMGQIVSLFVVVAVTTAYPAISHQSRVDGLRLGYTDHAVSHYNYVNFPDHFHHYPHYKFSYSVFDPHTGDHKSQAEYRRGGLVKGSYSIAEPGGNMRSVLYSADDIHGFNAIVHHNTVHHYVPHHHHY